MEKKKRELNEISKLLIRTRRRLRYSQEQMAELLGVTQRSVCGWERAEQAPSAVVLLRIMKLEREIEENPGKFLKAV